MNKHTYRTKKVNEIDWSQLWNGWSGQPLVLAVDIAKEMQYAELSAQGQDKTVLLRWDHLKESTTLIGHLERFGGTVTVVMESSGTYGDSLRHLCRQAGFALHQASAKRVHDAREIFDGVPSLHDAKAACLIAKLYRDGLTRPWPEPGDKERTLGALRRELELHQSQYERNQNRLEAYLGRHWPEVLPLLPLDSVTLEQTLKRYGSPAEVALHAGEAAEAMRRTGKQFLAQEKIEAAGTRASSS